jgi:hypothetical protein
MAVRSLAKGITERAAGGFRHSAARILGFHRSGQSKAPLKPRPTMQTKPLVPVTAVS